MRVPLTTVVSSFTGSGEIGALLMAPIVGCVFRKTYYDSIANANDIPEEERGWPEGHREVEATEDDLRRAGENR